MATAIETLGDPRPYLSKLCFTSSMLELIGGIAVLASNTEFWTEQAIWRLEAVEPAGTRPSTDGKPISALIDQLERAGANVPDGESKKLVVLWCRAAKPAYLCRNSIFHGTSLPLGSTPWFANNARWHGETRRRPFSDFHADDNTLTLLRGVFGVLLRSAMFLATAADGQIVGSAPRFFPSLREAGNVANELRDLAAAVNHEKY